MAWATRRKNILPAADIVQVRVPEPATGKLRVTKRILPASRGAPKLAQQFGDALVCVRHRSDDKGEFRYTTVELLVETARVRPRIDRIVGLRIAFGDQSLQAMVRAAGGTWDNKAKLWRIPRRVAGTLKPTDRIAEE